MLLIDDDAQNINAAIEAGVYGVFYTPDIKEELLGLVYSD